MTEEELTVLIGNNIAKYRKRANMTQAELAEKLDVSVSFISRVERGLKRLKLSSLILVAEILGISCDALLKIDDTAVSMSNLQHILSGKSMVYWECVEEMARMFTERFDIKE